MENTSSLRELLNAEPTRLYKINFIGKGSEYFSVVVVNWLLTALTLGFYYPWAKARQLQYLYSSTDFNDSRFIFHGTGKEMFKGFIKAILIFAVIWGAFIFLMMMHKLVIGFIVFYVAILAIIPIAIHGSYKYRMSRTSWRGIRMGYRGNRKELAVLFFKNLLLTVITLGIYGAWMTVNLRNYVLGNVKFGNLKFQSKANGGAYFVLNLKGYFLSIFTLFIYSFWWMKDLFAYYINNLYLVDDSGQEIKLRSTATGGDFFGLIMVNMLILIFTLGLGYAWVMTRTLRFVFSRIEMEGNINFDLLNQSEEVYTDATGEDISDILDFGFVI
jgi:uncharacterized membrane protein YjgN (DUF898 family)